MVVWFGTGQRDWLGKSVSEIRDLLCRLASQSINEEIFKVALVASCYHKDHTE